MTTEPVISNIHTLQAEPLSKEAFAPFGVVLTPQGRERLPINTYGDKLDLYRESFESDQPTEWFIVQGRVREMKALFLERHHHITQAFIPLNGDGFVMVVAKADALEDNALEDNAPEDDAPENPSSKDSGLPKLEHLHAFVIPGNTAIQLYRSTWHDNPFPLKDNQSFLVTSHQALTRGHQQNPDASLAQLPLDLERKWFKDSGIELRIETNHETTY